MVKCGWFLIGKVVNRGSCLEVLPRPSWPPVTQMDKMVGFLNLWLSTLFIGWHVEWIKITMHTGEKFLCSFNAWLDDGKPGSVGPPSKTSICNQGNSYACWMVAKKRPNASSNSHFQLYRTASTYICNTTQNIYESLSDVGEIRVYFASKILTPCRMHWNAFLIAQIKAKCHSFPNMCGML